MKIEKLVFGIFLIMLVLCLIYTSISCAQDVKRSGGFIFTSAAVGGGWYPISAGVSLVANKVLGEALITAVPGPGGVGNVMRVAKRDADIGISYSIFLSMAENGIEPYVEPVKDLRAVCGLTTNVFHFLLDPKIPGETVKEAIESNKPIKIAVAAPGDSANFTTDIILQELGYTWKDFAEVMTGGTGSRSDWWADRKCNAMAAMLQLPGSAIMQAIFSRSGKLLQVNEEVRESLVKKYGYLPIEIPENMYEGQKKPIYTVGIKCLIFAHKDVSEEVVYAITKAIAENNVYLSGVHSSFKDYIPEDMCKGLGIQLHPGAIRYCKEVGFKYDE